MGWLMAFIGAFMLLDAFNHDGSDFTTAKNEWQLGIGIGLIALGAIVAIIRRED